MNMLSINLEKFANDAAYRGLLIQLKKSGIEFATDAMAFSEQWRKNFNSLTGRGAPRTGGQFLRAVKDSAGRFERHSCRLNRLLGVSQPRFLAQVIGDIHPENLPALMAVDQILKPDEALTRSLFRYDPNFANILLSNGQPEDVDDFFELILDARTGANALFHHWSSWRVELFHRLNLETPLSAESAAELSSASAMQCLERIARRWDKTAIGELKRLTEKGYRL